MSSIEEVGRNAARFGLGAWAVGPVVSAYRIIGDYVAERERIRAQARYCGIPDDVIAGVEADVDRLRVEAGWSWATCNDEMLERLWRTAVHGVRDDPALSPDAARWTPEDDG